MLQDKSGAGRIFIRYRTLFVTYLLVVKTAGPHH